MEEKGKVAVKAGIWYTISSFSLKAVAFLSTPIFTRLLSQEEYGNYSNFISWFSILSIIVTLSMSSTLVRAQYDWGEKFKDYISSILVLSSIVTVICYGVVLFRFDYFKTLFAMDPFYIHIMFLSLLVSSGIDIFQVIQIINFRYKTNVFLSMGSTLATILVSVLLVTVCTDKLFGRVIGSQVVTFLVNILLYIYFIRKGHEIKWKYFKYALVICLPYLPHLVAGNLLGTMDRVMIQQYCGASYTALYSLAHQCAIIISTLLNSMNTAFSPWLGEKLHNKMYEDIKSASRGYVMLMVVPAIGLMLISPEILYILGGETYLAAKYVMPPLTLGCVCQFLYTLYVNVEQFEKKTVGMAAATVSAAVINGVLNFILIPRYGYVAAAYTTFIGYLCLLLIHYLLVRRLGFAHIYDTRYILMVLGGMMGVTVLVNMLYQYNIIRYVLIVIYGIVLMIGLWKNRKLILAKIGGRK